MQSLISLSVYLSVLASAVPADTNQAVLGHATLTRDILVQAHGDGALPIVRPGQEYNCIETNNYGYLLTCRDEDDTPRVGLLTFSDAWGHATAKSWTHHAPMKDNTVVVKSTLPLLPANLPLREGERHPIVKIGNQDYTIRYGFRDFAVEATLAKADVEYEPPPPPVPEKPEPVATPETADGEAANAEPAPAAEPGPEAGEVEILAHRLRQFKDALVEIQAAKADLDKPMQKPEPEAATPEPAGAAEPAVAQPAAAVPAEAAAEPVPAEVAALAAVEPAAQEPAAELEPEAAPKPDKPIEVALARPAPEPTPEPEAVAEPPAEPAKPAPEPEQAAAPAVVPFDPDQLDAGADVIVPLDQPGRISIEWWGDRARTTIDEDRFLHVEVEPAKHEKTFVTILLGKAHELQLGNLFSVDIDNPTGAGAQIALALMPGGQYHESMALPLKSGLQTVIIDLAEETFKSEKTKWMNTTGLPLPSVASRLTVVIYTRRAGELVLSNTRFMTAPPVPE